MEHETTIHLRSHLVNDGMSDGLIARQLQVGELERIRRGAYVTPGDRGPEDQHRNLVRATLAQMRTPGVASHESAAVFHGLPIDRRRLGVAHVTLPGETARSDRRRTVWRHRSRDITAVDIDGIAVTSLAQTAIDLARRLPYADAVAALDAALRRGVERDTLLAMLDAKPRHPGNATARRAVAFADPRSESPGESHSRVQMHRVGLPAPVLQLELADGRYRSDFGWEDERLLGEFDGQVKYGRLLKPGQTIADVVMAERERETELHGLGWWVVRWTWSSLRNPQEFHQLIASALDFHTRFR